MCSLHFTRDLRFIRNIGSREKVKRISYLLIDQLSVRRTLDRKLFPRKRTKYERDGMELERTKRSNTLRRAPPFFAVGKNSFSVVWNVIESTILRVQ